MQLEDKLIYTTTVIYMCQKVTQISQGSAIKKIKEKGKRKKKKKNIVPEDRCPHCTQSLLSALFLISTAYLFKK